MKKIIHPVILFFCSCLLFIACGKVPPEKYFNVAVLNSNMLSGFANNGMYRQLESPSLKLGEDHGTVQMKRNEVVRDKINAIEESFDKVKDLKETEETKEILRTSIALYEYVLPVFKKDYMQLAESMDKGVPEDQIKSESKAIHDKYLAGYDELYKKLITAGKSYAEKNNIKVHWNDN